MSCAASSMMGIMLRFPLGIHMISTRDTLNISPPRTVPSSLSQKLLDGLEHRQTRVDLVISLFLLYEGFEISL